MPDVLRGGHRVWPGAAGSREPWQALAVWAGGGTAPKRSVPAPTQPWLPAPLSRSSRWFSGSSWSFSLREVEEKFTLEPNQAASPPRNLLSRPCGLGGQHPGVGDGMGSLCSIVPPASVTAFGGGTEPTGPELRERPDTHGAQGFPSDPSSAP